MLLESGHFWCVFDASEQPKAGRMVRAFGGTDAEEEARRLARCLNGDEVTDGEQ